MAREVWEHPRLKRLLPDVHEALARLVEAGKTDAEIAAHLNVSRSTVRNIRAAAGFERNSKEKTKRVQIRLPMSLLEDLQREARVKGAALSDVIRRRCTGAA